MDFVYELLRAGHTTADSDSGSEVARKINDNFEQVKEALNTMDQSLETKVQDAVIQAIEDGTVELPIGDSETTGTVKSSSQENEVSIANDGTMEVVSLNIDKLVQTDGDTLILDGGSV